jgi:ribonuclease E
MKTPKHRLEVERTLKRHVKSDKAKTNVGKISRFGLLEMSRQRLRPSIEYGSYVTCSYCQGKGLIASTETLGVRFLRKLRFETLKNDLPKVNGVLPVEVADYLLNNKRKELLELEARRQLCIRIVGSRLMRPGDSEITFESR